jgi:outer membrane biosynthesis protein TonB
MRFYNLGGDFMKKTCIALLVIFLTFILVLACTPEKKSDYAAEINEKGKITAQADSQLAANKFDEAAATYQKALSELNTLKQKIPAGDPSVAFLDTLINTTKNKLDKIPAAKQQYEAKIAAETKKLEVIPEVKPEAKPKAKPKAKVEQVPKAQPKAKPEVKEEAKPEAKTEVKSEPQTKAQEPVKWKVVYRGTLASGEAEWHIMCGENLARIVRQDPKKKEKAYLGGYGGKWYDTLQEAAVATCSQ